MKLNNPMLFNGQLLATYKSLFAKLGITSNDKGEELSGVILSSFIDNSSLAGITVADLKYDAAQTVSAKLEALKTELQGQLSAYYEVTAAADSAIAVNSTLADGKETFDISLKLDENVLSQSADGLTVIPSAVIEKSGLTLAKLTSDEYASVYQLQLHGNAIGETINIPKDQFLTNASYVPSSETLVFEFAIGSKDAATGAVTTTPHIVEIPVSGLVDEYTAGSGITISDVVDGKNVISVAVEGNYLTTESGKLAVTNVATEIATSGSVKLATEGAVINYVTPISGELTQAIAAVETGLLPGGKYSAVEYVDTLLAEVTEAPIVNTLYVDSEGQTGIVLAGETTVRDISQEFVDSADAIVSGATELVTAGAVADYVTAKAEELTIDYTNKIGVVSGAVNFVSGAVDGLSGYVSGAVDDLSGAIEALQNELGNDLSTAITNLSGEFKAAEEKLTNDITAASSALAEDIADLAAVKKFVKVDDIDAVPSAVADTLYYTEAGQAKVYGADGWQSLSMEAVTDLSGVVSDATTATSQAIKTYVDNAKSEVSEAVQAVASDLTKTRAQAAQVYEEKIEFGSVDDATVTGRVIAVYDAQGEQCYPSIKYASGVSTIGLDEADVAKAEYTVVYAAALAPLA